MAGAVLAVIRWRRRIAVPLRRLDPPATRQTAVTPGTPLAPSTVYGTQRITVPGYALGLLTPLVCAMISARRSVGPGHGLRSTALVRFVARRDAPQRAALGLQKAWRRGSAA